MKKLLFLLFLTLCAAPTRAQSDLVQAAKRLSPTEAFDNIHVQKLHSDAQASVFCIWIKEKVRPHKHAVHSETVYVLQGKGTMRLGEKDYAVRKGDVIFIPQGTPHAVQVQGGTMKVLSVQAPEYKGEDRIFLD
ncbi:MAG: cupin domain-containing protein [Bacteroidota bacterium]